MRSKVSCRKTLVDTIKVGVSCISIALLTTCSPNSHAQAQETVTVEKEKLEKVIDFARTCDKFASACAERVDLLEQHKTESQRLLEVSSQEAQRLQEELESEKRKKRWLIPGAALALGLIVGFAAK